MAKKVKKVVEEPIKEVEKVEEEPIPEKKYKRNLTPEARQKQLEQLAKMRELAAKKKRELKEVNQKARNVEKEELLLKASKFDKIQEEKKKLQEAPKEEVEKPKKEKPKKKKVIIEETSSDDDDNKSSSSEEQVIVRKKKNKTPTHKELAQIDDPTIHQQAYRVEQAYLANKIMSDRINRHYNSMVSAVRQQYY